MDLKIKNFGIKSGGKPMTINQLPCKLINLKNTKIQKNVFENYLNQLSIDDSQKTDQMKSRIIMFKKLS